MLFAYVEQMSHHAQRYSLQQQAAGRRQGKTHGRAVDGDARIPKQQGGRIENAREAMRERGREAPAARGAMNESGDAQRW